MNRTKIEWVDGGFTWNPITGCRKLCRDDKGIYCWAFYMAQRQQGRNGYDAKDPFKPTIHLNRLLEPLAVRTPNKIFTCSMGDIFDDGVPEIWRDLVFRVMHECPQHTFIVLTKRPENIPHYEYPEGYWPKNLWLGVSVDGRNTQADLVTKLWEREFPYTTFVSFEPLLGRIEDLEVIENMVQWCIIGAQTGARAKQPRTEWVNEILLWASENEIPVFLKDNLELIMERVQDFPEVCA